MKLIPIAIFLLTSLCANAGPEELHVIFLSSGDGTSFLGSDTTTLYTQNGLRAGCVEFGEKCFHPQKGLIDAKDKNSAYQIFKIPDRKVDYDFSDINSNQNKIGLGGLNSEHSENLDCKEAKYFDIYCGKSKKRSKRSGFEIWIDTSTSMRNNDYQVGNDTCYREDFIKRIRSKCDSANVFQYASFKRQVGSSKTLCENHEQNKPKRLYQWIKASQAKHLLIITDVDSMNPDFQEVIDSFGGTVTGIEDRIIAGKSLKEYVPEFQKVCHRLKK